MKYGRIFVSECEQDLIRRPKSSGDLNESQNYFRR